jgi:hypothetical protein
MSKCPFNFCQNTHIVTNLETDSASIIKMNCLLHQHSSDRRLKIIHAETLLVGRCQPFISDRIIFEKFLLITIMAKP